MITAVLCSNDKLETKGRSICMTTRRVCAHTVCHTCTLYTKGMTECRGCVHTVCNAHYVQHMHVYVRTHTHTHTYTHNATLPSITYNTFGTYSPRHMTECMLIHSHKPTPTHSH